MMLLKVSMSPPWGPGDGKSTSNHLVHVHWGLQGVDMELVAVVTGVETEVGLLDGTEVVLGVGSEVLIVGRVVGLVVCTGVMLGTGTGVALSFFEV